jgi:aryl-alcohol dehydrogenase-like predicted oxidoreductase
MSTTLTISIGGHAPVPRIGLGCMGMSEFYGTRDDAAALEALSGAYELGYRHFDSADFYGSGHNEQLLGAFLRSLGARRQQLLIATKCGLQRVQGTRTVLVDSSPAYLRRACEESLRRLGVDHVDLYYLHRRSPLVPIEDTVGAMAELVKAGKVRALGLSEVSATTLRRAAAEHPIAALQSEYSLWSRDVEASLLGACTELGVALVAYSPLGRGFLTGAIAAPEGLGEGDLRPHLPRFRPENFRENTKLLVSLSEVAQELGASMAEVALAWLLAKAPTICPIPGSRSRKHLESNLRALELSLSAGQSERLSAAFDEKHIAGARYPDELLRLVNT